MKITLLTSPDEHVYRNLKAIFYPLPSLGLLYIAAVLLKNNFEVKFFDMQFHSLDNKEILNSIATSDLIGLTGMTPSINITYGMASEIRSRYPDKKIAIGGVHATSMPEEVIAKDFIDFVIVGEGERTFLELAQRFEQQDWGAIDGLVFKQGGRVVKNRARAMLKDIDSLPFPAYELLDIGKYAYAIQKRHPLATIITSRGCPGHCIYCNKTIFGHKFRYRSVDNVVEEMKLLRNKYGIREIHIMDDAFSTDIERAKNICRALIRDKIDIVWACPTGIRVDYVDQELLSLMKKSGCYFVAFGIESGDDSILKSIGKGTSVQMNRKAVKMAQKAGIETFLFYIVGAPNDTKESVSKTIQLAKELKGDYSKFSILTPYPGTPLYGFLKKKGRLVIKNWDELIIQGEMVYEPFFLTRAEVKKYWKLAYRKVIFSPGYILRKLTLKNFLNPLYLRRMVNVASGLFSSLFISNSDS